MVGVQVPLGMKEQRETKDRMGQTDYLAMEVLKVQMGLKDQKGIEDLLVHQVTKAQAVPQVIQVPKETKAMMESQDPMGRKERHMSLEEHLGSEGLMVHQDPKGLLVHQATLVLVALGQQVIRDHMAHLELLVQEDHLVAKVDVQVG